MKQRLSALAALVAVLLVVATTAAAASSSRGDDDHRDRGRPTTTTSKPRPTTTKRPRPTTTTTSSWTSTTAEPTTTSTTTELTTTSTEATTTSTEATTTSTKSTTTTTTPSPWLRLEAEGGRLNPLGLTIGTTETGASAGAYVEGFVAPIFGGPPTPALRLDFTVPTPSPSYVWLRIRGEVTAPPPAGINVNPSVVVYLDSTPTSPESYRQGWALLAASTGWTVGNVGGPFAVSPGQRTIVIAGNVHPNLRIDYVEIAFGGGTAPPA